MAWTTPRTWTTGEVVTKTIMDAHVRDNLNALKDPPGDNHEVDEASDYTTTSTSFVDVDATDLALTLTTTGGDVLIVFFGSVKHNANGDNLYFDVLEGTTNRLGGDDGLLAVKPQKNSHDLEAVCFAFLATGLSAGEHTFKLQWKVEANTGTLLAGAGTTKLDLHPQFWVREIS